MGLCALPPSFYRTLFYTLLVVILMLATQPGDTAVDVLGWDKLDHVLAFVVLACLIDLSYPDLPFRLLKPVALLGYGLAIESVQYLLPTRTFSLFDLLADGVGIAFYLAGRPAVFAVSPAEAIRKE